MYSFYIVEVHFSNDIDSTKLTVFQFLYKIQTDLKFEDGNMCSFRRRSTQLAPFVNNVNKKNYLLQLLDFVPTNTSLDWCVFSWSYNFAQSLYISRYKNLTTKSEINTGSEFGVKIFVSFKKDLRNPTSTGILNL